jgi:hypothetical protein
MARTLPGLVAAAIGCVGLAASSVVSAPLADHLQCYKAKETAGPGRIQATADLLSSIGLAPETGCLVKGPPTLFCGPVTKTNVTPPPPGGGPTGTVHKFLCYKIKCPTGANQVASGKDQFGVHTLTLKAPKILCAPASPSGAFLDQAPAS